MKRRLALYVTLQDESNDSVKSSLLMVLLRYVLNRENRNAASVPGREWKDVANGRLRERAEIMVGDTYAVPAAITIATLSS